MSNPIVDVIFGGQFGSEGKRLFNEFYYYQTKPDAIVSNFGPNSGGFVSDGSKWAVFSMGAPCLHMLSPGSIIDIERFDKEIKKLPDGAKVIIHENACVVLPEHKQTEKRLVDIGSTMTGTAAAVVQKIMRDPYDMNIAMYHFADYVVPHNVWMKTLMGCNRIQVSVPQGHSLSINHGFYPYCTSRNCSPQQALADAAIPIQWVNKIIACMRTFPIRVSNRYNDQGNMIGYSGPCYYDQEEITWESIGVKPEYTSVSKKKRRVFTFSMGQYVESIICNGVTDIFLNFANYMKEDNLKKLVSSASENANKHGAKISWLGYGPKMTDISSVNIMGPNDEIDGRIGCHPTIIDLGK